MPRMIEFKSDVLQGRNHAFIGESVDDCARWMRTGGANTPHRPSARTWEGLANGDTSRVARADKLLEQVATITLTSDNLPAIERVVSGGLADVPAYLSGSPVAMRQRRKREAPKPLTMVVDISTSASVSDAGIERRGVAVLALIQKLMQSGHPVTLYIAEASGLAGGMSYSYNGFFVTRLDTAPLDLARLCWALTTPDMARVVGFTAECRLVPGSDGAGIGWPKLTGGRSWTNTGGRNDFPAQRQVWADILGEPVNSIMVVPPVFGSNPADYPFLSGDTGAAQWVSEQYAKAVALAQELN